MNIITTKLINSFKDIELNLLQHIHQIRKMITRFVTYLMFQNRSGKVTSAPAKDADLKQITAYTPRMRSGSGVSILRLCQV
jgi:hypothetical protein